MLFDANWIFDRSLCSRYIEAIYLFPEKTINNLSLRIQFFYMLPIFINTYNTFNDDLHKYTCSCVIPKS